VVSEIPDVNSLETTEWVRERIASCDRMHSKSCSGINAFPTETASAREYEVPILPTRIISLGPSDSSIKLWQPPEGARGQYACPSHCWGNHQPLRTIKHNYAFLQAGIPWSDLPKTFREAIQFARTLDIPYLWIDSLCIIQDDIDDWNQEAGRMALIYNNSYITFSATSSRNCDDDLFHGKDPRKAWRLYYSDKYGNHHHVVLGPRVPVSTSDQSSWYLNPQNAERKARGEDFFQYNLPATITIV